MEAYECILSRRSIRQFTGDGVDDVALDKLIRAAVAAPSAGNQQPWHFIIIRARESFDAIMKVHPYSQMLQTAAAVIMVCGELSHQKRDGYWIQDCSAATQNILLAAHALGLGAVWLGVYPGERAEPLSRLVKLPEGVLPLCLIAIGHPAESKPPSERYDEARVHLARW